MSSFSLHASPACFQCGKQSLRRKQSLNSLFPSSWDLQAVEKRIVVPGGLWGSEPEKKSFLVNPYCSNWVFDFWKVTVTHEILELPLKDFMYGYSWQTYASKRDLKEFNTNPFTLSRHQGPGQKLCGVPAPLTQMAPDAVEKWSRSCSLPCFNC